MGHYALIECNISIKHLLTGKAFSDAGICGLSILASFFWMGEQINNSCCKLVTAFWRDQEAVYLMLNEVFTAADTCCDAG